MYRHFVSLRYIRRRVTALLAILAITFGVATLLTVLSIMEGYIHELQRMIREQESHLILRGDGPLEFCGIERLDEAIRSLPGVVETAPFIESLAMYRSGRFNPCYLRGIDPERELGVTSIGKFMLRPAELETVLESAQALGGREEIKASIERVAREILSAPDRQPLSPQEADELFSLPWRETLFNRYNPLLRGRFRQMSLSGIVVGIHLLARQNLSLGQIVKIVTFVPGTKEMATGNFLVTGAFKTGDYEVDSRAILTPLNRMKTLLASYRDNRECFDGLRVALADYREADATKARITQLILRGDVDMELPQIRTWKEAKQIFLQAVTIEKWIMGFVVSLLNVFTGCIVLLMLVLIVIEKTRDTGVLMALGASPRGVFSIFVLNGLIISALGTVTGLLAGTLFIGSINRIHDWIFELTGYLLFDPEVYLMDRIPTLISPGDVVFSVLPAVGFGLLASLIPALWAARKDPIQIIHNE